MNSKSGNEPPRHPRIVIVTYNWPPRNASGTHRPYSWARYWSNKGAAVTVLTAEKYDFDAPLDLHLEPLPGVEVIQVPWLRSTEEKLATLAKLAGRKWIRRARKVAFRLGKKSVDVRERWAAVARERAFELALDSDVVVSTFGPTATHLIASEMKAANPEICWIADYRDPWSSNIHNDSFERERDSERQRELATIESADLLTTVSSELADSLAQLSGKTVRVVENGFELGETAVRSNVAEPTPRQPGTVPDRPHRDDLSRVSRPGALARGACAASSERRDRR